METNARKVTVNKIEGELWVDIVTRGNTVWCMRASDPNTIYFVSARTGERYPGTPADSNESALCRKILELAFAIMALEVELGVAYGSIIYSPEMRHTRDQCDSCGIDRKILKTAIDHMMKIVQETKANGE